jgi:prepilin-type N-terminal cleavage/methylation domain-containing protein
MRRRQLGFTLIELLAVIAIISALAGMGIPAFNRYLRHAQAAEAGSLALAIADAQLQYRLRTGRFAGCEKNPPQVPGRSGAIWSKDPRGWKDLGFAAEGRLRYQYEVELTNDGRSFTVVARGDLDGDGEPSEARLGASDASLRWTTDPYE